jgi:heterodisulfide reductase subunit D
MSKIKTIAECKSEGKEIEVLFWVGCAGSYDARAQKVSKAFAEIMSAADVSFAILGEEEKCTGDPARRAGNEFLFQLLANQNIETLKKYEIKSIVTTCPHCFNTLKNEYPDLGGRFQVIHHTEFINELIKSGRLKIKAASNERITYHDSCYLGRVNGVYEAPREVLAALNLEIDEMVRSKSNGLCCGAGGAQMFKEDEPGDKKINIERIEEVLEKNTQKVISNCPFCLTMLTDGLKFKEKNETIMAYDLAEMIVQRL